MRRLRLSAARIAIQVLLFSSLLLIALAQSASAGQPQKVPAVRWDEQTLGCTFSRSDDGKLHFGLWSGDLGITLSLDSQELEKVHHRHEPFFGVFLNLRYRGAGSLDLDTDNISLQFLSHFKVVQTSLDPEAFAQKIQDDADALDHATAREIAKHPETQTAKQAYMRAFQKDTAELLEFVSKSSLRPAHLDAANQEASGWVLFAAESKWVGKWKKKEDFILRVPLEGKIFEFPFSLPPKPADLTLRRRD